MRHGVATVAVALACGAGLAASPRVARAGAAECIGDCDAGGSITINEIVTGVGIALGSLSLDRCPRLDCNGTGRVTVDCLIGAVDAALNQCDSEPTATPTPPDIPTPTSTATTTSTNSAALTHTQRRRRRLQKTQRQPARRRTTTPASCGSFVT